MRLLTLAEVARQLGISAGTARRIAPDLPGAIKVSKRIRYNEQSIAAFAAGVTTKAPGNSVRAA